mmetsp:Transcript_40943/g.73820  ORF Transcript_40943/g.73820 Transcript_40943/m.73820 type:complete len:357 (+) Transcript_40943:175-1245(+)
MYNSRQQRTINTPMAKSKGSKVYAVARGRVPGIYSSWSECQAQTKGSSGAIFKSFTTRNEAQAFMQANNSSSKSSSVAASAPWTASKTSSSNQDKKRSRRDNDTPSNQRKKQASSGSSNFRLQITIYFDGGSRGNPGLAGAGADVVVLDNNSNDTQATTTTTYSVREYCGLKQTNNFAEYHGLLAGLKQAKVCIEQYSSKQSAQSSTSSSTQNPLFQLQIYGDSKLIIQQLRGTWQCNHPNIKPLFHQCQQLIGEMKGMGEKSEVLYEHVYREHNKVADALANEAMDQRRSWTTSTADGSIDDSHNDSKKSAVAVTKKSRAAAETKKNNPASSGQEVIDVDDSDSDSHYARVHYDC